MEVLATAALALGQMHAGTANGDVSEAIVQCIMLQEGDKLMHEPYARFLPLALGLIYLGKQQQAEVGDGSARKCCWWDGLDGWLFALTLCLGCR
jgi:hypothetical protein